MFYYTLDSEKQAKEYRLDEIGFGFLGLNDDDSYFDATEVTHIEVKNSEKDAARITDVIHRKTLYIMNGETCMYNIAFESHFREWCDIAVRSVISQIAQLKRKEV